MGQRYRLELASPKTSTGLAKSWFFTPETENVISIEVDLKKDAHRVSILQAKIYDPGWAIFNSLPDCAFWDVPVKLYLGQPGNPDSVNNLVFEGKVTEYAAGYPGPEHVVVVAHDNAIDMRRRKRYRVFRNHTSTQLAKQIATEYGFDLSVSLGAITPTLRDFDFGAELSDWALISRALYADGLELYTKGKTLYVRERASVAYPITFKRGGSLNERLEVKISHIRGAGEGGDKKTTVALGNTGTLQALRETADQAGAAKSKADDRTHRGPVAGVESTVAGAHSENAATRAWTNKATQLKRRKDSATLTVTALPDIGLHHVANLDGWGAKVDSSWDIHAIRHVITGTDWPTTHLELMRGPSKGAASSLGQPALATQDTKTVAK